MQAPPERDTVGRRGRNGNSAQPRDMFMAHLAAFAARLNQTHLQPLGSLAEADEHREWRPFWRSYVFARNRATAIASRSGERDGGARRPSVQAAWPRHSLSRGRTGVARVLLSGRRSKGRMEPYRPPAGSLAGLDAA
jgi:hypothetical protein